MNEFLYDDIFVRNEIMTGGQTNQNFLYIQYHTSHEQSFLPFPVMELRIFDGVVLDVEKKIRSEQRTKKKTSKRKKKKKQLELRF